MNSTSQTLFKTSMFEVPEPPEEFGQDGGKFYRAYDALAEELDEDMTKSLKEQLDGMLIFAGLFAGVNSAFLAVTLPLLSADPADDTNALLAQNNAILMQLLSGRNDSAPLDSTLPSKSFAPTGPALSVNILFALSLAFAIISSFLAVLGRQWLVYYRKRSGGGPDRQRWEQLKRFLGAERWGLEFILDDVLPSLLQTGLIIFCVSFAIYLNTLSSTLSTAFALPLCLALASFVGSAICTLWDRIAVSASWIASITLSWMFREAEVFHFCQVVSPSNWRFGRAPVRSFRFLRFPWLKATTRRFKRPFSWVYGISTQGFSRFLRTREGEDKPSLQAITIQRIIRTSEDPASLLHAAANILAITSTDQLKILWDDETVRQRLVDLPRSSYSTARQQWGSLQFDYAASAARLYWCATTHILIHVQGPQLDPLEYLRDFGIPIPSDRLAHSSPVMIRASFVYFALSTFKLFKSKQEGTEFYNSLADYCSALERQDWGLLSLVFWTISRLQRNVTSRSLLRAGLEAIRAAYMGDVDITLLHLNSALAVVLDPGSEELLKRYGIVTIMLRCVNNLIAAGRSSGRIGPEDQFRVLGGCEAALRTVVPQDESIELVRNIRMAVRATINELLPGVFEYLNIYFEKLVNMDMETVQALHDEDLDVIRTFCPLMRDLWLYSPYCWATSYGSEWHNFTGELRTQRGAARRSFNTFVSKIDKVSCRIHGDAARTRDPEVSWCQWTHEPSSICIAAKYFLPSVLFLKSSETFV
ncbi:hypothetical protein FRC01_008456 [Tulasnella sp. 417]|nr:hypothetical protein FRC01_008456 [Tulasnella sp. 417]